LREVEGGGKLETGKVLGEVGEEEEVEEEGAVERRRRETREQ